MQAIAISVYPLHFFTHVPSAGRPSPLPLPCVFAVRWSRDPPDPAHVLSLSQFDLSAATSGEPENTFEQKPSLSHPPEPPASPGPLAEETLRRGGGGGGGGR